VIDSDDTDNSDDAATATIKFVDDELCTIVNRLKHFRRMLATWESMMIGDMDVLRRLVSVRHFSAIATHRQHRVWVFRGVNNLR
jgi:hypothetical protein